ncbi:MAG: hypothetical protein ACYCSX_18270 [Acidimicrobiales bacterium]
MRRSTDRSEQVQLLRSGDAVSWEGLYTRMYQSMVSYAAGACPQRRHATPSGAPLAV